MAKIVTFTPPPPPRLQVLALRFFHWITPRWLSRKYEVSTMGRFLKRHRADVEHEVREQFREMVEEFGETGPSEEYLMVWFRNSVDSFLHPQAKA